MLLATIIAHFKPVRKLLRLGAHVNEGHHPPGGSTSGSSEQLHSDDELPTTPPRTVETFTTSAGLSCTEDELLHLIDEVKDYQLTHGSVLKTVQRETESFVPARPVGSSILPTAFPRRHFEKALDLQQTYNELYIRVASDPEWLHSVLGPLIKHDNFIAALWDVYVKVRDAGLIQNVICGVFRSDYMIHQSTPESRDTQLKQVEINTFSCSGACHAERIANMHHHLARIRGVSADEIQRTLPRNENTQSMVDLLKRAHEEYSCSIAENADRRKCVLMTVQPYNFNIADERPIQYVLWDAGIPCYRCEWPLILERTTLSKDHALMFRPLIGDLELEVSVIYYRSGYEANEYLGQGKEIRLRLEMSCAIKCPDILTHLTNMKSVQQALAVPGALERFLPQEKCEKIRDTFMPMYPLDSSPNGLKARHIARDPNEASKYVLKPNRDGGGHNIYRTAIPGFLSRLSEEEWHNYILMSLIQPPSCTSILVMPEDIYAGNVVSELGVFGTCLWRRDDSAMDAGVDIIWNKVAGFTYKTKRNDVDEMSVVKGYGCFDCPYLMD